VAVESQVWVVRWGVLGGRRVMLAVRASPLSESESGQALAGELLVRL
jgi:hypothetical protein